MKKPEIEAVPVYRRIGAGVFYAALCLLCCMIIFSLYQLPYEAILYAAMICAFIGFIFLGVRTVINHRRRGKLRLCRENVNTGDLTLPPPQSVMEAEYQALARELTQENRLLRDRHEHTLREMRDDYTLWAHQIKTPIAALRLLLSQREDDMAREEALELMRIEEYVEMALSVQRLSGDSSDLCPREYDLDAIVRKTVRKYSRLFIRKHLNLRYEALHARVVTDEKWLGFILEQTLMNALKYTEQGGIDITMEGYELIVSDTGIGIAPEELPRVFERGYTGYNGRAGQRATGMGLYLCRKAAGLLGHTLRIESVQGAGTRVRIGFQRDRLQVE